jgi:hypothetical protein
MFTGGQGHVAALQRDIAVDRSIELNPEILEDIHLLIVAPRATIIFFSSQTFFSYLYSLSSRLLTVLLHYLRLGHRASTTARAHEHVRWIT